MRKPNAEQIAAALEFPARVVYLGRKNCLPSGYLLDRQVESENALRALLEHPLPQEVGEDQTIRVRWDRREKLPSDLEGLAVRTLNTPGRVDFRTHLEKRMALVERGRNLGVRMANERSCGNICG